MRSSQTAHMREIRSLPRLFLRFVADQARSDAAILIGLPLLIAVGAILGVINLLAFIHLVAVLLSG